MATATRARALEGPSYIEAQTSGGRAAIPLAAAPPGATDLGLDACGSARVPSVHERQDAVPGSSASCSMPARPTAGTSSRSTPPFARSVGAVTFALDSPFPGPGGARACLRLTRPPRPPQCPRPRTGQVLREITYARAWRGPHRVLEADDRVRLMGQYFFGLTEHRAKPWRSEAVRRPDLGPTDRRDRLRRNRHQCGDLRLRPIVDVATASSSFRPGHRS
jgi:hypothetical protein